MKANLSTLENSLFEQILESSQNNSEVIAIHEDIRSITYGELQSQAESIAQQLYDYDCQIEEPIAIITNGGIDMIAGMIGSMQVAATFVPLDFSAPIERTTQMLSDLQSRTVIADEGLNIDHIVGPETNVIRPQSGVQSSKFRPLRDESIIYGFFTSGSTGQPKCCLNTHLGLSNRFAFNSSVKSLSVGDSILQNSKHTFDAVLWQTLWPLTAGATVVIPKRDKLVDIERTVNTIYTHNVVMTDIVPSVLTVLLDYLDLHQSDREKLKSLTELFVGGEETSVQLVQRIKNILPWVRLTNTYGPTEAAIGMIYHHFDGTETDDIPLGKPIPGATAVILDEDLKPVAEGVVGQLAIGGNCLGAGYHNDILKTEKAFPTIGSTENKQRVFLTGDRAVVKNERLYFRGRADKQIKIRGVRIELKEVETSFEAHPEIIQFRVVPVSRTIGGTQLYAFYTAHSTLPISELKGFAHKRLPSEFIPSHFQQIDAFETTSAGKIDRTRLRNMAAPKVNNTNSSTSDALKTLVLEQTGLTVDSNDNLFLAGLDSLNAMRLALAIEQKFNISISARQLYENPTIAAIDKLLESPPVKPPSNFKPVLYTSLALFAIGLVMIYPTQVQGTLLYIVKSLSAVIYLVTLGIVIAAWITASGASKHVAEVFNGNLLKTVIAASAIGTVTPVCGLAILPVMAGLLATRVPLAPVMAFWLSSPVTGPAILTATAATLGMNFAIGKALAAFGLGIFGGLVVGLLSAKPWIKSVLRDNAFVGKLGQVSQADKIEWAIWRTPETRHRFAREFLATARLVLMCLIPAFIAEYWLQHLLEPESLSIYVGEDVWWAIPLTVLIGAPAYIDAFAALPLTRSLMDHGMSTGAAMSFLVSGGVVSIWGAMAIFPVLKIRPFLLYLTLAVTGSMAVGWLFGMTV